MAAYMLNLNIVIGTNDRVTATVLGDEERGEEGEREIGDEREENDLTQRLTGKLIKMRK